MFIIRCCGEKPGRARAKVEVLLSAYHGLDCYCLSCSQVVSLHQISPPTASPTAVQPASVVCGWLNLTARSAAEQDTNAASPIAYKP